MRLTIIALILSIAALGLGSFATFKSVDGDNEGWSEAECEAARITVRVEARSNFILDACRTGDNCSAYSDMLQAIFENCE